MSKMFLQQLYQEENPKVAFRTFLDKKDGPPNPSLILMRCGHFDDIKEELVDVNRKGAGIFFVVNKTDGKGQRTENIVQVTAVFVDLDGSPIEPVQGWKLKPHIIIESSPKRYHAYWILDKTTPMALPMFSLVQKALAEKFNGDITVHDLPRVMRLPGFLHNKKEPAFMTNLIEASDHPPFTVKDILDNLSINETTGKQAKLPVAIGQGKREVSMVKLAGAMRRVGMTEDGMYAALLVENSRCIPPLEESELKRIAGSVMRYKPTADDFHRDPKDGHIYATSQFNVRLALEKLDVIVMHDIFAERYLYKRGEQKPAHLSDIVMNRLWLEIDESFRFRPSKEFFTTVILDHADHKGAFHPVRDYLDALKWDQKPRVDTWLINYGDAEDTEYTRAIGKLFLLAAVRRVRTPGVKFDEVLVLESKTGKDKSSAIEALCPNPEWFSDNLPINADSKIVIEITSGKWILELAELSGLKKSEIESVKAFLSRGRDTARLAYDRMITDRPRHWVPIATTNSNTYLRDMTGNRRFFPCKIVGLNATQIKKDRDQLWAEASYREAQGESIRLDPKLYTSAEVHQEQRRLEDPWEVRLSETIPEDINGKIIFEDIWKIVGSHDISRRTHSDNARIADALQKLGFEKTSIRHHEKIVRGYVRGTEEERKNHIRITLDEDNNPIARVVSKSANGSEWETVAPKPEEPSANPE